MKKIHSLGQQLSSTQSNHQDPLCKDFELENNVLEVLDRLHIFIPKNESCLKTNKSQQWWDVNEYRSLTKYHGEKHKQELLIRNQMAILRNMIKNLDNLDKECEEENFEKFSETARENARKILNTVYGEFPQFDYDLYPTEEREVAIDCTPHKGQGCLILCDSDGSVAYFATLAGKNSRFRCDSIDNFPYDNLWRIFREFKRVGPGQFAHPSPSESSDTHLSDNAQYKTFGQELSSR